MVTAVFASLLTFTSATLLAQSLHAGLGSWWGSLIHTYAKWIVDEFESMFEALTVLRAKQLITAATTGAAIAGYLLGGWPLAAVGAVFGYYGPRLLVVYKRHRRMTAIDDQLVDALHLMSNALKSGLSLQQSLEMAFRELMAPIADEFGRIVKDITLGRLIDDALRRFAERTPLDDVKLSVDSILMLRETGGNLTETFHVIAHTVTERKKVEGKIKAMTMQGVAQCVVIGAMPIGMLLLFSLIAPDLMHSFYTTVVGWLMLSLVFVLDGAGVWMILKIVKVNV